MTDDPKPRVYYSPVVCWTSEWNQKILDKQTINKESKAWQKAYDAECVRKTNERRKRFR